MIFIYKETYFLKSYGYYDKFEFVFSLTPIHFTYYIVVLFQDLIMILPYVHPTFLQLELGLKGTSSNVIKCEFRFFLCH